MEEDEVYLASKALLKREGWLLLGGQPPSGCDSLPVIEVKAPTRVRLGSKGAFKPDLVAFKCGVFLLVECKPTHNDRDAQKLREILGDEDRLETLYREMNQRSLFQRHHIGVKPEVFKTVVRGAIAHAGSLVKQSDLLVLLVRRAPQRSEIVLPS